MRISKQQPKRLNGSSISAIATILDQGKPTRFRFEGAVRYGVRSWLILHRSMGWAEADDNAAAVIKAAFLQMRIVRPPWYEGQPDFVQNEDRILCANESCQKPIVRESLQALTYCSEECRLAAKNKRSYRERAEEARAYAAAARAAARASGEIRNCEWCSLEFRALDYSGKKPQRFCSLKCRSAYASSFAASWRPRQIRDRQGRFIPSS